MSLEGVENALPGDIPGSDGFFSPEELPQAVAVVTAERGWQAGLELETAHWDRFVDSHPDALLAAISTLPGEAFVAIPSLLVGVNYLKHLIASGDPSSFYDFAYDAAGRTPRERETLDRLIGSAGRTAGHRTQGRLTAAVRSASEGRRMLDELPARDKPVIEMTLPHLLLQWGRSFDLADAGGVREYEESWELANLTSQPLIARRAAASLAWMHADQGRLNTAERWIARALGVSAEGQRYDAPLHLAQALVSADRLEYSAAAEHLLRLTDDPVGEYWAAEIWVRSWIARSPDAAAKVVRAVEEQVQARPDGLVTDGSNARYIASALDRAAPRRDRSIVRDPAAALTASDHLQLATAAHRRGRMHDVLQAGGNALEKEPTPRVQATVLVLTAAARLSLDRRDAAVSAFGSAHEAIASERLYSVYTSIARDQLDQLAELSKAVLPAQLDGIGDDPLPHSSVVMAQLSRRERQLLIELASDRSLPEIAEALFVSHNTVKTTASRLYRKLSVHSRQAAADIAHQLGLA
jgi:ATP/maltotriose-dependent transcriptional regulator MalT